jgi:serine/threonine protein phosphatase PrpC
MTKSWPPQGESVYRDAEVKTRPVDLTTGRAEILLYGDDAVLENQKLHLFGVFDGVGGTADGDIAARISRNAIGWHLAHQPLPSEEEAAVEALKDAFRAAWLAIHKATKELPVDSTMATTATVLHFFRKADGHHWVAYGHVGDSRLYHRNTAGEIICLTRDEVLEGCIMNLLQPRGMSLNQFAALPVWPGDRFMVCSDGITPSWEDDFFDDEVSEAFQMTDPQAAAERFTALSQKRDDKSVLVIDCH